MRKHLPVIGINIQLGVTRVFNPIKKILSSLSVLYQTVRLRKRFFSVLFYSELKQKNATLRERHASWRSSEKKSLEGNQQLTLGGELVRGAELSCCRSCCDVWLGVDGGVKLAVKSSSTPWDDCRSAAGRAAGGQVPTQQTPANYRTIKAKTIKNIWIRELDYLDKICFKAGKNHSMFFQPPSSKIPSHDRSPHVVSSPAATPRRLAHFVAPPWHKCALWRGTIVQLGHMECEISVPPPQHLRHPPRD